MRLDELLERTTDSLKANMVYGEPYEKDGVTVIPAARIAGGGGGGDGKDEQHGQQGEGAGIGLTATPTGAYILKDGKLRWEPAVDVNRLVTVLGVVALGALFFATRIVKIRAARGPCEHTAAHKE
ncbi:sporulation protein [Kibdelosporangium aridum]|uniref:Sporulation protein n=1 Tax=Kibdelosporangium aridum TaxID=2030 RepID=A0A428ZAV8_KIBAR|nr:spore germination protein GerW family protein [Kibdelosporangium aridum]RSM85186.1 sporulation protein [Kibdelosporangium aridum]